MLERISLINRYGLMIRRFESSCRWSRCRVVIVHRSREGLFKSTREVVEKPSEVVS